MSFLINPYVFETGGGCSGDVISTLNLGAYWKFDGDYTDSSPNSNTLNPNSGGGISPSFVSGKYNDAVSLGSDGSNGPYLQANHSSDFNSSGNTWTLSTWIYIDSFANSGDPHVIAKRSSMSNGFRVLTRSSDTLITCGLNLSIGSGWSTGSWEHLVLTRDGNTIEAWRNGSSEGTATITGTWDTSNDLVIGCNDINLTTGEFDGDFDDYAIFRRKLTSTEINDLYNSTCPLSA